MRTLGRVKKEVHCLMVEGRLAAQEGLQGCKSSSFYKMSTSPTDRTWEEGDPLGWKGPIR